MTMNCHSKTYYLDKKTPVIETKRQDDKVIIKCLGNAFIGLNGKEMTVEAFSIFKENNRLLAEEELGQMELF